MNVVEENIKRVHQKMLQVLKHHQQLQKENEQLSTALAAVKKQHEEGLLRIAQLEQQAGILKSAAGKMNETDKKSFEKHIDQYIREVDKCIGLLSE